ncbi:hypothetical protein [Bacillus atrophaeus]|uniref:hypothetical protein n=1 Tax=Bacillus atrophaeus TaxID=1452 RepID=UPI00227D9CFD|nr:hypothetical protein [Bacillus atrophaeus]MCY8478076.1 hypothetical protein [Bacillus atrophaeus]MED1018563.1 hypothetical protein [Bacillus atrophaeus]MED1032536.1 hypothetical protein [Bacillus atrophaeus]MED1121061.1 hypothetical protein [Bacillus atrophaeus]
MKTKVFEANLFVNNQLEETIESPESLSLVFKKAQKLLTEKRQDVLVRTIQQTDNERIRIFDNTLVIN